MQRIIQFFPTRHNNVIFPDGADDFTIYAYRRRADLICASLTSRDC